MTEQKRPSRRTGTRTRQQPADTGEDNPYLEIPPDRATVAGSADDGEPDALLPKRPRQRRRSSALSEPAAGSDNPRDIAQATEPGDAPARRARRPAARKSADKKEAGDAPQKDVTELGRTEPPRVLPEQETPPSQESRRSLFRAPSHKPPRRDVAADEPGAELRPSYQEHPQQGREAPMNDSHDGRPHELNRYDRAFDRTDGPEQQTPGPETRQERSYRQDRRDRGGRRRGRNSRHRGIGSDRSAAGERSQQPWQGSEQLDRTDHHERSNSRRNGRRSRRPRRVSAGAAGSDGTSFASGAPPGTPVAVEGTMTGWFDPSRDVGFLRRSVNSYLPDPTDPYVPASLVRLHQLRRGDQLEITYGRDHRGRVVTVEVQRLNDGSPVVLEKRPEFGVLVASYPDRKLTLETGRPAKAGPELTRRAIDLIAPIGYGQRALIVAPARAGKTTLLQAIVEGVAINHPQAVLLILLVDERPEEVSEMITWGYGEVVASSFDMPPKRHVEVAEMTLERARRLVEQGKDVVIVLDSITRLARAHNTVDRGTGRTMSGGLDATAMQKPKAFFGSARMIAPQHGGGSLTIIATALVETGSRMDDVIFEEFKGTGNCEIKLDRSLADRRIFPAFDIATSGTRREEKLYRPDQLEKVYLLRRGLHQLPPQAGMEWLIKRIAATSNNDSLLDGL